MRLRNLAQAALIFLSFVSIALANGTPVRPIVYDITPLVHANGSIEWQGHVPGAKLSRPWEPGMKAYFVDLSPLANWAHPAKLQIWSGGRLLQESDVRLPPRYLYSEQVRVIAGERVNSPIQFKLDDFGGRYHVSDPSNFYAILINGAGGQRHWNDFSFLYRTLVTVYGYDPANIFVADSNFIKTAPDLDGDGKPDIRYESTIAGVKKIMADVKALIKPGAHLVFASNDHGDVAENGESTLVLEDGEMKVSEFAPLLNSIPAGLVLSIFEPCYSGGFVRPTVSQNRVTLAAATNLEESWGTDDDNWDTFIYEVIQAFARQTPDGHPVASDLNHDSRISAQEAFAYAVGADSSPETPLFENDPDSGQSQQIGIDF